jgi:hypothetical protein
MRCLCNYERIFVTYVYKGAILNVAGFVYLCDLLIKWNSNMVQCCQQRKRMTAVTIFRPNMLYLCKQMKICPGAWGFNSINENVALITPSIRRNSIKMVILKHFLHTTPHIENKYHKYRRNLALSIIWENRYHKYRGILALAIVY